MRTRIIGIVLIIVSLGIDAWLAAGLATRLARRRGSPWGSCCSRCPSWPWASTCCMSSRGEIKAESKADKERAILNSVMTRGRVSIADLAIEGDLNREQVRDYIYDLIGKDLFRGYVNWDKGELVSAEAAQIKDGQLPQLRWTAATGRARVWCAARICGTETYLSPPAPSGVAAEARPDTPPISTPPPAARPPAGAAPPAAGSAAPTRRRTALRQPDAPPAQPEASRSHRASGLQDLARLPGQGLRRRPCPASRRRGARRGRCARRPQNWACRTTRPGASCTQPSSGWASPCSTGAWAAASAAARTSRLRLRT